MKIVSEDLRHQRQKLIQACVWELLRDFIRGNCGWIVRRWENLWSIVMESCEMSEWCSEWVGLSWNGKKVEKYFKSTRTLVAILE